MRRKFNFKIIFIVFTILMVIFYSICKYFYGADCFPNSRLITIVLLSLIVVLCFELSRKKLKRKVFNLINFAILLGAIGLPILFILALGGVNEVSCRYATQQFMFSVCFWAFFYFSCKEKVQD